MEEEKPDVEDGLRHLIKSEDDNIYLFISEPGKHEVTIPDENRRENERERRHMDAVMRRLSELHGHFDMEA